MKRAEYAIWLIEHRKRLDVALAGYIESLATRKPARVINRRFERLMAVLDETDQLGASPREGCP